MNRGQKFAEFMILFVGLIFLLLTAAGAPAPGSAGGDNGANGPNVSSADHSDKSGDLKDVLPLHPNGGAGRKKGIGSFKPSRRSREPAGHP